MEEEILQLGFIQRTRTITPTFTKLCQIKRLPPFNIRIEQADWNAAFWIVRKDRMLITIATSITEIRQAIRVLTCFERDTFAE